MQHIETVTVGAGGAASISFSAIPDSFTDLLLVYSLRGSNTANYQKMEFNGSAVSFTQRELIGDGSAASSSSRTDGWLRASVNPSSATSSTFANAMVYINNYLSSANKSFSVDAVTENNATSAFQTIKAGLWSNTAAITSITLAADASFVQYSSASLFGIKSGTDGIVTVS